MKYRITGASSKAHADRVRAKLTSRYVNWGFEVVQNGDWGGYYRVECYQLPSGIASHGFAEINRAVREVECYAEGYLDALQTCLGIGG